MKQIAPMTAPHYKDAARLSSILAHGGYRDEALNILAYALPTFPKGDRGQHGSQCLEPATMAAVLLSKP
jgi:hypothetical protein